MRQSNRYFGERKIKSILEGLLKKRDLYQTAVNEHDKTCEALEAIG